MPRQPQRLRPSQRWQRGFGLVELIVVITLSAILAMYASSRLARDSEESLAKAGASYLTVLAGALQQHTMLNFDALANATDVVGTANDLVPTIPELLALGRLTAGFPTTMPTRQSVAMSIVRQNCPGANCLLTSLACTTTPLTIGGTGTRFDLTSTMTTEQGGIGGQSLPGSGATIRGPNLSIANPMGNVEGIVCSSAAVDTAMWQQFVRIGDTRDPNLKGPLTVAGATTINNSLTVTGDAQAKNVNVGSGGTNCITLNGMSGTGTFGCPSGTQTTVSGSGVIAPDLNSTGAVTAATGITSTGGNIVANAGAVAGQTVRANGVFLPGAACTAGSIGQSATGMLVCLGGTWRSLAMSANAGDACAVNGTQATGPTGISLICVGNVYVGFDTLFPSATANATCSTRSRIGYDTTQRVLICHVNPADSTGAMRWSYLNDLVTNLTFVSASEVVHDQKITKPACTGVGAQPIIQLIPKVETSSDVGFARFALNIVEAGISKWQVQLLNGSSTTLTSSTGSAVAIAQVYCYVP